MVDLNKIYNCDNQEILKQLPDKSIQVFLEDMPFEVTACKWDKMPNLKEYWDLRLSKLKDNGCFVLFGIEPFSSYLRMSNIKMYKYDWIWNKKVNGSFAVVKYRPGQITENIMIFGKKVLYKPIMTNAIEANIRPKNTGSKLSDATFGERKNIKQAKSKNDYDPTKRYPTNILEYSKYSGECNQTKRIHPTQKPVELFEYLIKTYSNENDLIFDGFSGSGTTAIACKNTNRNFICCENDKEFGYYDKSIERLNNHLTSKNLVNDNSLIKNDNINIKEEQKINFFKSKKII